MLLGRKSRFNGNKVDKSQFLLNLNFSFHPQKGMETAMTSTRINDQIQKMGIIVPKIKKEESLMLRILVIYRERRVFIIPTCFVCR